MSEVTFPTTPISGGSLSLSASTALTTSIAQLSPTRYVVGFVQYSPVYLICAVYDITNQKTATPTSTLVRQQVILLPAAASNLNSYSVRCIGMSSNTFMVLYANNTNRRVANVVTVDPTTGVMTVRLSAGVDIGPARVTMTDNYGPTSASNSGGVMFEGSYIKQQDNNVLVASRDATTGTSMYIDRFVYNPTLVTLTWTRVHTYVGIDGSYYASATLTKIPGSDKVCIQSSSSPAGTSANTYANARISGSVYTISPSATTAVALTAALNATPYKYVPLTETTGVVLTNCRASKYFSPATGLYGQTSQFATSGSTQYSMPTHIISFSDSYYGFFSTGNGGYPDQQGSTGTHIYFRVVKFTDKNFSQVSPGTAGATATDAGVKLYVSGTTSPLVWFGDIQPFYDDVNQVIAVPFIGTSSTLGLKFLWF